MFCINCGKPLDDEDRFCRYCGTEINYTRAANAAKAEKKEPEIRDIEERVRRRSEEINKKTEDSIRVENTEVMPEREVTFVEEGEVPEESTEVMPDHEVTFTEEDEIREEKSDDDSDKIPTEDMILSQTIKLLKDKKFR